MGIQYNVYFQHLSFSLVLYLPFHSFSQVFRQLPSVRGGNGDRKHHFAIFFPERNTIAVPKQHDVEIADFFLLFLKSAWGFFWYIFFLTLLCSFYLVCNSTLYLNDLYKKNLTYVVYLFSLYTSATYKPVLPVPKVYI